jgi:hypothetical protein
MQVKVNGWLLAALLVFIVIVTIGYVFWNAEGKACPECNGTGKVWVPCGLPDITTHVQLAVEQDGIECTLLQV